MEVTQRQLPRHIFRYVEGELFRYRASKQQLALHRGTIITGVSGQDAAGRVRVGSGNTVESKVMRLLNDREINRLEYVTKGIDDVLAQLTAEWQRLVELKYFRAHLTSEAVSGALCISLRTFHRWRSEIIEAMAYRLGVF